MTVWSVLNRSELINKLLQRVIWHPKLSPDTYFDRLGSFIRKSHVWNRFGRRKKYKDYLRVSEPAIIQLSSRQNVYHRFTHRPNRDSSFECLHLVRNVWQCVLYLWRSKCYLTQTNLPVCPEVLSCPHNVLNRILRRFYAWLCGPFQT